ncbi:hypothetical protein EVAR_97122_1 [Eumeta japonica]|uniref:Uncharacterized protein n=1 Tax=Eumeta variegata TaxID=151549 RepID=A0A4C1WP03_EUMVA|nr:hypothetical protein EVAR_97122_1 [Eumeta japonica]
MKLSWDTRSGDLRDTPRSWGLPVAESRVRIGSATDNDSLWEGEKAGPQASSSSDCSSSVVENLATGEYTITRSNSHLCNKSPDLFCYVCGEFEPRVKNMSVDRWRSVYRHFFLCAERLGDNRWTTKTTLWADSSGQSKRGRPNSLWVDDMTKVAGVQWTRAAEDRENWSSLEEALTFRGEGSCQHPPVHLTKQ